MKQIKQLHHFSIFLVHFVYHFLLNPMSSLFILFYPFSIFVILGLSSLHHVQIHWFQKNALRYKNPWTRSLGSIYLQNVLLDPILSLITKCRAQGFGKCITSSTRNYDIRFPLYKKVCVRNVPHKKMGLLQKGVFCNGLEASHLVGDILRGIIIIYIHIYITCSYILS